MGKLDFYYSQFRTWADEFDNSTMEQKKMIACQLIREVKVSRGYELEIVFDLNYPQSFSENRSVAKEGGEVAGNARKDKNA